MRIAALFLTAVFAYAGSIEQASVERVSTLLVGTSVSARLSA